MIDDLFSELRKVNSNGPLLVLDGPKKKLPAAAIRSVNQANNTCQKKYKF